MYSKRHQKDLRAAPFDFWTWSAVSESSYTSTIFSKDIKQVGRVLLEDLYILNNT